MSTTNLQANAIHQFLHGYAEGHRLLQSSLKLPSDLARLMLRMSDLSGSSVVSGFEQYITGYPLDSIDAYALAMTWYASEMPRPGCVWTHTLVIPSTMLATIPSLVALTGLFKRPRSGSVDEYNEAQSFCGDAYIPPQLRWDLRPEAIAQLSSIFSAYYGPSTRLKPVVLVAKESNEYTDAIFALWSQQWPELRRSFSFCTGSLSGRSIAGRAFDIQCSPAILAKDIAREAETDTGPFIGANHEIDLNLEELGPAIHDAMVLDGGPFRKFLWSVAGASSSRSDFASYVRVFEALSTLPDAASFVDLIASKFPGPTAGRQLKGHLVSRQGGALTDKYKRDDILLALSTTDKYASFDVATLLDDRLVADILAASPQSARALVVELFHSNLNPFGDEVLTRLVRAMDVGDAREIIHDHPQILPALFHVNPGLAASSQLWTAAGDRKRELMDSLVSEEIRPDLVPKIISALLDSGSDEFMGRAFERWRRDAVFAALDWTENHEGSMSRTCRGTLASYLSDVMSWIESGERSISALAAVVHVVAPYTSRIAQYDSKVWLRTARALQESGKEEEAVYTGAFLMALALCNAPPAPLELIAESFEAIYRKAEKDQLKDEAWMILEPLVPELSWFKNWDKCERMRRALLLAFMRYSWPAWEINHRIKNSNIRQQILARAHKVDADHYFRNI